MSSFLTKLTGFPVFSRKWDPQQGIPDLTGKVAIVTGANTGLGYITALELLKKHCKVYIACRSKERAQDAITRLNKEVPGVEQNIVFLPFDLTDLESAVKAAKEYSDKETRLDIIIANAAIMAWPYEIKNGIEVQFWNHLGHYALIQSLLPLMIKTSKDPASHCRIVNVSSLGHTFSPLPDFSSIEGVNKPLKSTWARYGQSKLANILYSAALQNHLANEKIRVLSLHPGNVHTELTRGPVESFPVLGKIMKAMSGYLAMTPQQGALTQLYAATSPEIDEQDLKAAYFMPIATLESASKMARDPELSEQLWRFSESAVKKLSPQSAVMIEGSGLSKL